MIRNRVSLLIPDRVSLLIHDLANVGLETAGASGNDMYINSDTRSCIIMHVSLLIYISFSDAPGYTIAYHNAGASENDMYMPLPGRLRLVWGAGSHDHIIDSKCPTEGKY